MRTHPHSNGPLAAPDQHCNRHMRRFTAGAPRKGRAIALSAATLGAALGLALPVYADDINWVGYQYVASGGISPNSASWFHGDQWFNYLVPGVGDRAIFDAAFDPQANGMPRNVYFGNYVVAADPPNIPSSFTVQGGDATVREFEVREGDFTFRFTDSSGTGQRSLTATDHFVVGSAVQGSTRDVSASLTVSGGLLSQSQPYSWDGVVLGQGLRSTGRLVADGSAARIDVARDIWIGNGGGTGYLEARNGGTIRARAVGNGLYGGPNGEPTTTHIVSDGTGSFIGPSGGVNTGSILVSHGGRLSSLWIDGTTRTFAFLGGGDESNGVATIDGRGSLWSDIDRLTVGGVYHTDTSGHGELNVSAGGLVSSIWLVVGNRSRSSGVVRIHDPGSEIVTAVGLLGDDGHGDVSVTNGGRLTISGGTIIGNTDNGRGYVRVSDMGSVLRTPHLDIGNSDGAQGLLEVAMDGFVEVGSTVGIRSQGQLDLRNGGRVLVGAADVSAFPSTLVIGDGGILSGDGIIHGRVVNQGGTIRPGNRFGALNIEGDLQLMSGGTLSIEIAGLDQTRSDRIIVTGANAVRLGGTLEIAFVDGFTPREGDTFDLLALGATTALNSSAFDAVMISGLDSGLSYSITADPARHAVTLRVRAACGGDFSHDGVVSVQDLFNYLTAWFARDPRADINRSGDVDVQDIFEFLAGYFVGCD